MSHAGLGTLPMEVATQITSYLFKADLVCLAKMSRIFRSAATPELYRSIVVNEGENNTSCVCLLFRTICEVDYLANLVEHFGLLGPVLEAVPGGNLDAPDLNQRRKEGKLLRPEWKLTYPLRDATSPLSLLLLRLKSLRSIDIGVNHLKNRGLIESVRQILQKFPDSKLRSVSLARDLHEEGSKLQQNCWSDEEFLDRSPDAVFAEMPVDPDLVLNLCTLKRLQSLDILLPADMRSYPRFDTVTPSASLKTLILRSTICGEDTLKKILRLTSQLRSLSYERFYDHRERPNRLPNPRLLLEALLQVKDTLEELRVKIETYRYVDFGHDPTGGYDEYPGPDEPIGSLQELQKLHTLEIPMEILFGEGNNLRALATLLPKSLQNLALRNDFAHFSAFYPWTPETLGSRLSADLIRHASQGDQLCIKSLHLGLRLEGCWWRKNDKQAIEDELGPHCRNCDIQFSSSEIPQESYSRGIIWFNPSD